MYNSYISSPVYSWKSNGYTLFLGCIRNFSWCVLYLLLKSNLCILLKSPSHTEDCECSPMPYDWYECISLWFWGLYVPASLEYIADRYHSLTGAWHRNVLMYEPMHASLSLTYAWQFLIFSLHFQVNIGQYYLHRQKEGKRLMPVYSNLQLDFLG